MAERRIDGWGFVGESYPPPPALLSRLEQRLGRAQPGPTAPAAPPAVPPPRTLPDLGLEASVEPPDRLAHARGQGLADLLRLRSGTLPALPDAVLRPADQRQVETILRRCGRAGVRVIPRGGGTSVTGGVNVLPAEPPTVVLDLERLAGLEWLDAADGLATFGAGTTGPALERALATHGLTLGHFPQSWELSTLGGWIATRSSGQESLGYGSIEAMVAGLELAAPAGRLALPSLPASAAGPDLRQLVLGSEGRFGIITRATVRVRPQPRQVSVSATLLPDWEQGLQAMRTLTREGPPLTMLRLSDQAETEAALELGLAARRWARPLLGALLRLRGLGGRPCLMLVGAAGDPDRVASSLDEASTFLRRRGGLALGTGPGRRWLAERFRHPYLRDSLLERGFATETLETAAPWSLLPGLAERVRAALATAAAQAGEKVETLCHVSHTYRDGASLYFTLFFRSPPDLDAAVARWAALKRAASETLAGEGATLSHHHGVGSWHAPWLAGEIGERGTALLAAVAGALDPDGILNPAVLLDPADRLEE